MKAPYKSVNVECRPGLAKLYEPLIDLCQLHAVKIMQIKEKFGGLRFYIQGENSHKLDDIIRAAEVESYHVCEDCGTSGQLYDADTKTTSPKVTTGPSETSGWLRTLCNPCRIAWDNFRRVTYGA